MSVFLWMMINKITPKVNSALCLPCPSFLKEVFRRALAEGRVLDPFECGGIDAMESLRLH